MSVFQKFLRAGEGRRVKQLAELVAPINALEPEIHALSDAALQAKTGEFRARLAQGEDIDDLLIEAFAVVREGGLRVLGQRHYDVQLMGGMALHFGWIAEMKTGRGQDPRLDAPRVPERPHPARRARGDGERLPREP